MSAREAFDDGSTGGEDREDESDSTPELESPSRGVPDADDDGVTDPGYVSPERDDDDDDDRTDSTPPLESPRRGTSDSGDRDGDRTDSTPPLESPRRGKPPADRDRSRDSGTDDRVLTPSSPRRPQDTPSSRQTADSPRQRSRGEQRAAVNRLGRQQLEREQTRGDRRAAVTRAGQQQLDDRRRRQEQFGDFDTVNPVTDNEIEEDFRRADEEFVAGLEQGVELTSDTVAELTGATQADQESLPARAIRNFVVGGTRVFSPGGAAVTAQEGAELVDYAASESLRTVGPVVVVDPDGAGRVGSELVSAGTAAAAGTARAASQDPGGAGARIGGSLFVGAAAAGPTAVRAGRSVARRAADGPSPRPSAGSGRVRSRLADEIEAFRADVRGQAQVGRQRGRSRSTRDPNADIEGVTGGDPTGAAGTRGRAVGQRGQSFDPEIGSRPARSQSRAQAFGEAARRARRQPDDDLRSVADLERRLRNELVDQDADRVADVARVDAAAASAVAGGSGAGAAQAQQATPREPIVGPGGPAFVEDPWIIGYAQQPTGQFGRPPSQLEGSAVDTDLDVDTATAPEIDVQQAVASDVDVDSAVASDVSGEAAGTIADPASDLVGRPRDRSRARGGVGPGEDVDTGVGSGTSARTGVGPGQDQPPVQVPPGTSTVSTTTPRFVPPQTAPSGPPTRPPQVPRDPDGRRLRTPDLPDLLGGSAFTPREFQPYQSRVVENPIAQLGQSGEVSESLFGGRRPQDSPTSDQRRRRGDLDGDGEVSDLERLLVGVL